MVSLIAAMAANGVIGDSKSNQMLWHIPADFKYFKEVTSGHPIIMGRKTFESLPGVLPDRFHFVVSRNKDYKVASDQVKVVKSLATAVQEAENLDNEVFVIGGGQIYSNAIKDADKLYITKLDREFDGDVFSQN
ncbi:MAG: dihydrofolate reductase [Candidatus Doudnabacteria bacterium]